MPKLPECVCNKRRQNQEKDYLLSRFKRSLTQRQERALNYLKQSIKSSELITIVDSMHEDEQTGGHLTFRRRKQRSTTKKKLVVKSESVTNLCSLESEDNSNKALFDSKLTEIVKVLRQANDEVDPVDKSAKLSSILQVLRDPPVSDPPIYSVDSYAFCLDDEEEGREFSTLDRRRRQPNVDGSGSSATVPSLRSSLGAGGKHRVSVYAFLDELGHTLEAEGVSGGDQFGTATSSSKPSSPKHHYRLHAAEVDSVHSLGDCDEVDAAVSSQLLDVASTTALSSCSNDPNIVADSTPQAAADISYLNYSSACTSLAVCGEGACRQEDSPKPSGATPANDSQKPNHRSITRSMSANDMLDLDCEEEVFDVPRVCEPTMTSMSTSALTGKSSETEMCSDFDSSRENMANTILRRSENQDQTSLDLGGRYSITQPPNSDTHLDQGNLSCVQESSSAVELLCRHGNSKQVHKHMSLDDVLASRHSSTKSR